MKKNHKNKFKTPEGYFDSFNERLLDKIVKEESVIPPDDGFSAPDGYFEYVHDEVYKKIQPKVIQLKNYRKYYFAAASIAAIVILTLFFNQNNSQSFGFDDLANAEIDAYFESNDLNFSTYELAEVVTFENLSIMNIAESENSIDEDILLEYLDENVDEIEDLNLNYDEFE
ncbi:hypothetical protein [Croceitalea rosinachiae]|uniref:Uncharacterized protein n=1 Tax=Croceitalea rosinachiae TaxID=3075596 RepID=A0ABU3AB93_9FLAO|nr:hypothetical protein [Croceitalea sp. F388]MDT0607173.1 hypothetical protein [Croceitalea sp. F388]